LWTTYIRSDFRTFLLNAIFSKYLQTKYARSIKKGVLLAFFIRAMYTIRIYVKTKKMSDLELMSVTKILVFLSNVSSDVLGIKSLDGILKKLSGGFIKIFLMEN